MVLHAIGAERIYLRTAKDGVAIDITNFTGITTTTDTLGRLLSVVIDIDVSSAEAKRILRLITSSHAIRDTKESDAGTT